MEVNASELKSALKEELKQSGKLEEARALIRKKGYPFGVFVQLSKFTDLLVCQVEMMQSPCYTICSMRLLGAF